MDIFLSLGQLCSASQTALLAANERRRGVYLHEVETLIAQCYAAAGHYDGIAIGANIVAHRREKPILFATDFCTVSFQWFGSRKTLLQKE